MDQFLRRMETPISVSAMFSEGDNFNDLLFAYRGTKSSQNWVYS